jgi:hypothetical protein
VTRVTDGDCHTLSNAYLDTPWFKTSKLLAHMKPLCSDHPSSSGSSGSSGGGCSVNIVTSTNKDTGTGSIDSTIEEYGSARSLSSSSSSLSPSTSPATTTTLLESFDTLEPALLRVLLDREQADTSQLPSTGLTLEQEKAMSSIFIDHPIYGTVSSTILMVNATGVVRVAEYTHSAGTAGQGSIRTVVEFPLHR